MTSKRRLRRKSCEGKTRYDSKSKAHRAMVAARHHLEISGGMSVYKCKFCGGWHYGHSPHQKRRHR